MYIYNVTVSVDKEIEEEWKTWMKETHIPEVLETGFFIRNYFFKVLFNKDEDATLYSVQYMFEDMKDLQKYQAQEAPLLQKKHTDKYGEKCSAFRSVLEMVR